MIEGLEKDLERLKRFEENLRIRKLRTMKGGDKIINETDEDRHNAAIGALHQEVEGQGAHILYAEHQRMQMMRHMAGQLNSIKDLDLQALEEERMETQRKIAELTEIYLGEKEKSSKGVAQMMRRKMGYAEVTLPSKSDGRHDRDRGDHSEDEEATYVRGRSGKRSSRRDDADFDRDIGSPRRGR